MSSGNILIADDDQTLCYLLKEELINEGYIVDITFDGKYAIRANRGETLVFSYIGLKSVQAVVGAS